MYFSGKLTIDPSKITKINKVAPTKAFRKLLHLITAGGVSDREELETFTAVSILQQFNMAMRTRGITDIVRLAKDDVNFYLDTEGKKNDLKEAIDHFELEVDHLESKLFNRLTLVLEHEDEYFKYLIQVNILRKHRIGEYPICLTVNAVYNNFKLSTNTTEADLKSKMGEVFTSQETYDQFILKGKNRFERFLNELKQGIKKFIQCDDIGNNASTKIVRPRETVNARNEYKSTPSSRKNDNTDPIYYGYYGIDDYFFYNLYWADMCYQNHIFCRNIDIVDEHGKNVLSVGNSGFDAGITGTLNTQATFEPPHTSAMAIHEGSEFSNILATNPARTPAIDASDGTISSWFDSISGFCSSSSDGGSSCESSCSSCGGGCCGD